MEDITGLWLRGPGSALIQLWPILLSGSINLAYWSYWGVTGDWSGLFLIQSIEFDHIRQRPNKPNELVFLASTTEAQSSTCMKSVPPKLSLYQLDVLS